MNTSENQQQEQHDEPPPAMRPKRLIAWPVVGSALTAVVIAAGSSILTIGRVFYRPMLGSTRSSRLQWQGRQAEIDQVIADEQSKPPEVDRDADNH